VEPLLSEDGKTAVFTEQSESGGSGYSVYLRKLDGSAPVRLGEGNALALSPDGKWVLTCVLHATPPKNVLLPTGAGEPRKFPKDAIDHSSGAFGGFLPDGKHVLFIGNEQGRPPRVFIQDLAGGAARPVTAEGTVAELLSPDGATLVVRTAEEGFAVASVDGGPARAIPGLLPGDRPLRWAADGRSLFVHSTDQTFPARVFRVDTETGRREAWKDLVPGDPAGISLFESSAISADGKTIFFSYVRQLSELYLADGLK
jgi:Tol biopolymer transport system component